VPSDPRPYDHVRGDGTAVETGIYRVVGVDEDRVTLLRVADGRGRRVHEGAVEYVDRDEYGTLEPADNPDRPSLAVALLLTLVGAGLVYVGSSPDLLAGLGTVARVPPELFVFAGALVIVVGVRRLRTFVRLG
jgi:hypothetical protein